MSGPTLPPDGTEGGMSGPTGFMALAEKGEEAIVEQMEQQCRLTEYMRDGLMADGWQIVNDSKVGVLNFIQPRANPGRTTPDEIQKQLEQEGEFWLSTVVLPNYGKVLRACVTSSNTREEHIDRLVRRLNAFLSTR